MSIYEAVGFEQAGQLLAVDAPPNFPSQPPIWDVILTDGHGNEWAMTHWTQVDVTENSEGVTIQVQVPAADPSLAYLTALVSDIQVLRQQVSLYRCRVIDANDTFTTDTHNVTISAVDYGQLLRRRVLFNDQEYNTATEQFEIAWDMVEYTQQFGNLGIVRGTDGPSGVKRTIDLQQGQTILDAINLVSRADQGFDWWVAWEDTGQPEKQQVFHMQFPRRVRTMGFEWKWGVQIREITRTSAASEYASVVFMIGATSPTEMHNNAGAVTKTVPPPKPQIVAVADQPFGRWERTYAFNDILTVQALINKGKWLLKDITALRATYSITLEPGTWRNTGDYHYGDRFMLRIESPPRFNFQVLVRMEEIRVALTPDGETVTLAVRAEEPETVIPPPDTDVITDDFERTSIGPTWIVPAHLPVNTTVSTSSITDGFLVTAADTGVAPVHQWGFLRNVADVTGDQFIEVVINNSVAEHPIGQIEIYLQGNDTDAACQTFYLAFYSRNTPPGFQAGIWNYLPDGTQGPDLSNGNLIPIDFGTLGQITLRFEAEQNGLLRYFIEGTLIEELVGVPMSGARVGFAMNWNNLSVGSGFILPMMESMRAGRLNAPTLTAAALLAPTGEIVVDLADVMHGASETCCPVSPTDQFVQILTSHSNRLDRIERSNYNATGGGTAPAGPDEVFIGDTDPGTTADYELWFDTSP